MVDEPPVPDEFAALLAPLDEQERELLRLRFGLGGGEPRTLEEVGELLGLTRADVRVIEEGAMKKLPRPDPGLD